MCVQKFKFLILVRTEASLKVSKGKLHNHYTEQPCDVTLEKSLYKCLKNMHTVSVFYFFA